MLVYLEQAHSNTWTFLIIVLIGFYVSTLGVSNARFSVRYLKVALCPNRRTKPVAASHLERQATYVTIQLLPSENGSQFWLSNYGYTCAIDVVTHTLKI